jgi:PiT family inorganic phosphate transporter
MEATAYAVNDGQRMLAVLVIAFGLTRPFHVSLWQLAALAGMFSVGAAIGVPRYSRTFGADILAARPPHGVVAELATAGVAFAGVGLGTPLSMTQTISGGLVGAGMSEGVRRVRWERASRLVVAWALTLPASVVLAALMASLGESLSR